MDLIIHTNFENNRLAYTCHVLFNILLGIDYKIVLDQSGPILSQYPIISYSTQYPPNTKSISIPDCGLLDETDITSQAIEIQRWNNLPIFFCDNNNDIPFDIIAASFYLISRYEEYLPFESDAHGRFTAAHSLAHQAKFLHIPLVHSWLKEFVKIVQGKYRGFQVNWPSYKYTSTFDIDYAWAYSHRRRRRTLGGYAKDFVKI